MVNSNLNCSAESCTYNDGGACFSGSIKVDGEKANTTSCTCCSTYVDRQSCGFTNSSNDCDCVGTDNIHCKAHNCKYNDNESCKASNVKINAGNASCETFCCE